MTKTICELCGGLNEIPDEEAAEYINGIPTTRYWRPCPKCAEDDMAHEFNTALSHFEVHKDQMNPRKWVVDVVWKDGQIWRAWNVGKTRKACLAAINAMGRYRYRPIRFV